MAEVVTSNGKTAQALVEANWAKLYEQYKAAGYSTSLGTVTSRNWRTNTPNASAPKKSGLVIPASVMGNWTIDYQPDTISTTLPRITVSGNKFRANGADIVLRGFSLIYPDCYYQDFSGVEMVQKWFGEFPNMNCVRVPCYPDGADINYTHYGITNYFDWFVDPIVALCGRLGIYCIIDWHSTGTNWTTVDTALKAFWDVAAARYKDYTHVIYEIYNEPDATNNGFQQSSWDDFKPTMQGWVNYVRAIAPNSLLLVGTPIYSQLVKYAATNPLSGSGIGYVHHVYPGHVPGGSVLDYNGSAVADTTLSEKNTWIDDNICTPALTVPVCVTEIGYDLADTGFYLIRAKSRTSFIEPLINRFNLNGVSYTGWSLFQSGGPSMLTNSTTLSDFGDYVSTELGG